MKKKICAILLAMTMSFSLAACGGADTQPAIDAFNNASSEYDAVADKINAESELYTEELFTSMNEMADTLLEYKEKLESDEEFTEEEVTEMIQTFEEIENWAADTNANLESFKIIQPAIDAFNRTSEAFNTVANAINENIELYPQEVIDTMNLMADSLTECNDFLSSDTAVTEEFVQELVSELNDIEAWVADVEAEILVTP